MSVISPSPLAQRLVARHLSTAGPALHEDGRAKSVASEASRISPTVVQSADVNAFRTLVENRTCREDRRREAYHRDRELADSGKGPMGPLLRGRITAHDQAPGCGAPKISTQQVIGPPAFTDRDQFCRRVFLLLLPGAVSC